LFSPGRAKTIDKDRAYAVAAPAGALESPRPFKPHHFVSPEGYKSTV